MIRSLVLLALLASAQPAGALAPQEQREVVARVADLIERRYVDPEAGKRIAAELKRDPGSIAADTDGAFAKLFTERLRLLSGDGHFAIDYDPTSKAVADGDAIDPAELDRWYGAGVNHGFQQVSRIDEDIGYLDLRVFAPVAMGGDLARSAMALLAQSPALIIDLRRNGGGMDDMTRLLAAFVVDGRHEMSAEYDRPSNRTTRHFTPSLDVVRQFGGKKPLYILVSRRTFSAAEAFAYDLQAMKRAVIVGEQTGGGAHPFAYRPVSHGFILSLPEGRSINPITGGDWEGVGVTPDVAVPADRALDRALSLAKRAISEKHPGDDDD